MQFELLIYKWTVVNKSNEISEIISFNEYFNSSTIYTERNKEIISSKKWYNTRQLTAVMR